MEIKNTGMNLFLFFSFLLQTDSCPTVSYILIVSLIALDLRLFLLKNTRTKDIFYEYNYSSGFSKKCIQSFSDSSKYCLERKFGPSDGFYFRLKGPVMDYILG